MVLYSWLVVLDQLDLMCTYLRMNTNDICNRPPNGLLELFKYCDKGIHLLIIQVHRNMTSKMSLVPKNTYHRCAGRAFNFHTSGSSMDGLVGGDSLFCKSNSSLVWRLGA